MKMKITLLGAALLAAAPALAVPTPPAKVKCEVKAVEPEFASFHGPGTIGPQVGETIELDLTQGEITKLQFSGGGAIPVSPQAKLVRKQPATPNPYLTYFDGTYKSRTSDYIGLVQVHHAETVSSATIEVLRKRFFGGMELHRASLECQHLP